MTALRAIVETSRGPLIIQLFEAEAPETVANFTGLATGEIPWVHPNTGERQIGRPLYNGTTFHRVITDFMIQTGDPLSVNGDPALVGSGGPGFCVADELHRSLRFDRPGRVAMAGRREPDTNGSQWFITEVAAPHLNPKHTIFGEVVKGFELVPKISRAPAGTVVIRTIRISGG